MTDFFFFFFFEKKVMTELRMINCFSQCYEICSFPAGIFHSEMQSRTVIPLIPPRVQFRLVLGHSGQFRVIPADSGQLVAVFSQKKKN